MYSDNSWQLICDVVMIVKSDRQRSSLHSRKVRAINTPTPDKSKNRNAHQGARVNQCFVSPDS